MQTKQEAKRRPFHEAIVDAIREATPSDIGILSRLIKTTKIPKGHDEIITAWNQWLKEISWENDLNVPADLLEQKQEAAAEEEARAEKKGGINLDELQQEAEKLLALLKDRAPDLTGWNKFMQECLEKMHELTSEALGK